MSLVTTLRVVMHGLAALRPVADRPQSGHTMCPHAERGNEAGTPNWLAAVVTQGDNESGSSPVESD